MRRHFHITLLLATATLLAACTDAETGAPTETVTVTESPRTSVTSSTPTPTPAQPPPATSKTPTPTSLSPTNPPTECTPEALARDVDPSLDTILYCDGQWLRGGQSQTDWVMYAFWDNGRWVEYGAHGRSEITEYPCFNLDQARSDGVPEEILGIMAECD